MTHYDAGKRRDIPNEVVEVEVERLRREAYSRTVDYQRAMSMLERAAHELAAARAVVDAARNYEGLQCPATHQKFVDALVEYDKSITKGDSSSRERDND